MGRKSVQDHQEETAVGGKALELAGILEAHVTFSKEAESSLLPMLFLAAPTHPSPTDHDL